MDRKHRIGAQTVLVLVIALAALTAGAASADVRTDPAAPQPDARAAQTITVDSPADSGPGTLRQALLDAQSGDTIIFDTSIFPPGAPATMSLTSPLPPLDVDNVTIDASDAGVVLDGSVLTEGSGLRVNADRCVISGLEIYSFPDAGVYLPGGASDNLIGGDRTLGEGPSGQGNVISGNGGRGIKIYGTGAVSNTVTGNFIGTDASGTTAIGGNGHSGIWIAFGAQYNQIGGLTEGERNIVSGNNANGIQIEGTDTAHNVVIGNYVGTDVHGTGELGNGDVGVSIWEARDNVIGGSEPGSGNLISGNSGGGVAIRGSDAASNTVSGNFIGVDASGTASLGNDSSGVHLWGGAHRNVIGGSNATPGGNCTGACNVISANGYHDVEIRQEATVSNTVAGNYIGTDVTGVMPLEKEGDDRGIFLNEAVGTIIGGRTAAQRNVVNNGIHIYKAKSTDNVVIGNYVGLGADGSTALGSNWLGVGISDGASGNRVGGSTSSERNVISGNQGEGVGMWGSGTMSNTVSGNIIGLDASGTTAVGNSYDGVYLHNGPQWNVIGGDQRSEGNVVSGNGYVGIELVGSDTTSNTVSANLIGTNASGTAAVGNRMCGLSIEDASYNTIGGSSPQERNIISGNEGGQPDPQCGAGLALNGASHNRVIGNYVGTDFSGSEPIGNLVAGIQFGNGSTHNLIKDNVASANAEQGIKSWREGNTNNTITGNLIGLDASGDVPMGNGRQGLTVIGSDHSEVISNVVADNGWGGVMTWASPHVTVRGNTVYSNTAEWGGGIGIGESPYANVDSNVVYSNTAKWGGGVYIYRSPTATLSANQAYSNAAEEWGGGIVVHESPGAYLTRNSAKDNAAGLKCGGVDLVDCGRPVVENMIIADNRVGAEGRGGGLCARGNTTAHLLHNTIAGNHGGDGAGVRVAFTSTVAMTNTILVGHTVGITVGQGCTATFDHTLWGSGTAWANDSRWINHGTLLHAQDLGGHPRFLDPNAGDYHLGPGSAAAEAATATRVTTDIDGDARPIGAHPDLGADEAWKWVFLPATLKSHSPGTEPSEPAVSAAFVYQSSPGSFGWTYEHDRGRRRLESALGSGVVTTYTHDIGGGAEPVIRQYAEDGWDVIFATSFGFGDALRAVAPDFPDVAFEHCSGAETETNLATYFGRMYQPRYLSGIVAGAMTESDVIGYVAPFEIPEVVRGIDAFTLGVRDANPDAEVHVAWSSTWVDPSAERQAAEDLLDEGADVIAQHQSTLEPQEAAKERGALSIGYESDMRPFVGNTVLTGPTWDWGAYYVETVRAVQQDTWTSHAYWGGLGDGVVRLAEFSPLVPQSVRDQVEGARQRILAGDWDIFCGPINAQDGTERVAAGECLTDEEMREIDWYVEGVVSGTP